MGYKEPRTSPSEVNIVLSIEREEDEQMLCFFLILFYLSCEKWQINNLR